MVPLDDFGIEGELWGCMDVLFKVFMVVREVEESALVCTRLLTFVCRMVPMISSIRVLSA